MMDGLSRRQFLRNGAVAGAAAAVPLRTGPPETSQVVQKPKIKEYRTLGRTGMKVSDIGLGAAYTQDAALIDYVLDCGVNYVDTGERYSNGRNEALIGELAGKRRKDFFLTTKLALRLTDTEESLIARFNQCLSRLQTRYVDVLMAHDSRSKELISLPAFHSAFRKLKADGKARFLGLSEHDTTMDEVCNYAIEDGRFDVVLLVYNFMQEKAADIIKNAKKKEVGVVIMKALAASHPVQMRNLTRAQQQEMQQETARRIQQFQKEHNLTPEGFNGAAIRWILQNRDVGTILLSMRSFDDANRHIPSSGGKFTGQDPAQLDFYAALNGDRYCRHACGICQAHCPDGVAVNDVLRIESYFTNYREEKVAMVRYRDLAAAQKPMGCASCPGYCERQCPYGLPVRQRLIQAHALLSL
jgi:uncharacterized protein